MSFSSFMAPRKFLGCHYAKQLFDWARVDGELGHRIHVSPDMTPRDILEMQDVLNYTGRSGVLNLYCLQQVIAYGPKILRLSNLDFGLLEMTDLNLSIEDYSQPYHAVVIEYPDIYKQSKKVIDPLEGCYDSMYKFFHGTTHVPEFAIIVHEPELNAMICTVYMDSVTCYSMVLCDYGSTIEEEMDRRLKSGHYDGSLKVVEEELIAYRELLRVSMNACLFVMDYGKTHHGPENPTHIARLRRHVQLAERSNDPQRVRNARRALRMHPSIFTISQDIKLHVNYEHNVTDHTGVQVKPHRRRGHYRIQRYGPGLTERKRIRIAPVFVNAHLFFGDEKDTSVVIHD